LEFFERVLGYVVLGHVVLGFWVGVFWDRAPRSRILEMKIIQSLDELIFFINVGMVEVSQGS
jgi:hypothetical protein